MFDEYGNEITWYPELKNSNQPIYKAIAHVLEQDILQGTLKAGFKLPPQRILANFLGVNHSTITRAFKICELKGLIRGTIGKGTFVASDAGIPSHLLSDSRNAKIIEMGMLLPLYEVNKLVEEALQEIYQYLDYSSILTYAPPQGLLKHRYTGAQWLRALSVDCESDQIIVTSGTQNALSTILITLFEKGDKIIVDEYTFTGFKTLAKMFGITLLPVRMTTHGMDLDELEKICQKENAKGIYLMPDCHNPTSITLTEQARMKIAEIIKHYELLLMEDSQFLFTVQNRLKPISSYVPDFSIFIAGTSKSINPAFRISFMKAPKHLIDELRIGINNLTWMASTLNAEIVSQLIHSTKYNEIITTQITNIKERNQLVDHILGDFDLIKNETSLFRYLRLPEHLSDREMEQRCLDKGVQIFSAKRFLVSPNQAQSAIRLSITGPRTVELLEKGLHIIKEVLLESDGSKMEPII